MISIVDAPTVLGLFQLGVETLPEALHRRDIAGRLGVSRHRSLTPPTYSPRVRSGDADQQRRGDRRVHPHPRRRGLSLEKLTLIVTSAVATGRACGMDVAIFNPQLDPAGRLAERLAAFLVGGLALAP